MRKWIFYQHYGNMTIEISGSIWCIDHCYPLAKCNLVDKKDLYRYINWVNLRPKFVNEKSCKGSKIDHRLYIKQEIEAKDL